jgi:chromosome segregation ATPase
MNNQINTVVQEKVSIKISYDVLTKEKKKMDQKYVKLTNLKAKVDNQIRNLQHERDELQQKKDNLERTKEKLTNEKKTLLCNDGALSIRRRVFMENIEHMIRTLLTRGGQIVDRTCITVSLHRIQNKQNYNGNGVAKSEIDCLHHFLDRK